MTAQPAEDRRPDEPPRVVLSTAGYGPAAVPAVVDGAAVDYGQVRRIRRSVADRLSEELSALRERGREVTTEDQRMLGRALIDEEVTAAVSELARSGRPTPGVDAEQLLASSVFADLFGLGRLDRWVANSMVENIDVNGCDNAWATYADGRRVAIGSIADSDADLVEMLQGFAAYAGQSSREFSAARPLLNLRLPDGARLAAWMGVTPRPGLSIRRHRLVDVTLDDLHTLGSIDLALLGFLRAAVRARKNIIVTGGVNAGKTTLLRALANEVDPVEKLVVIEKEYELGLDRLPGRHEQVVCMEARDANAEGAGAVGLAELVTHALRMNPSRIIVGEVRGEELIPMLTAMGSGNDGSFCTLHANSAHASFHRMAAIGLAADRRLPAEATFLLAADAVDLVVHISHNPTASGGVRRYVSSVLEVTGIGEAGRVTRNEVFRTGADGRAVPGAGIACLAQLTAVGFDPALLDRPDGWWNEPVLPAGSDAGTAGWVR